MGIDSIRDLRLFVRIFELGSISAASASLGLSPGVASKRLQALEADLGEALFHRSTRRLAPTGAGAALFEHARTIIATADEAEAALDTGDEPCGLLRVTTSVAFGRLYLTSLAAAFLKRHPRVRMDIQFSDRFVDLTDEGIDLAIRICVPREDSNFVMRRLSSGRRILCAARQYIDAHGAPATAEDLARHNCIVLNHYDEWRLSSAKERLTVRARGNFHCDDVESVLDAIRHGLGIGILALWHAAPDLAAGKLQRVLPTYALCGQPDIFAIYPPNQRHVSRVRKFVEFIASHLALPFDDPDEFLSTHAR